jgi:hypothetical protein
MSNFIKFTSLILNINCIQSIVIKPNKYYINVVANNYQGSKLFGTGNISSYISKIEVCETKNYIDYKILSDWINNNYRTF